MCAWCRRAEIKHKPWVVTLGNQRQPPRLAKPVDQIYVCISRYVKEKKQHLNWQMTTTLAASSSSNNNLTTTCVKWSDFVCFPPIDMWKSKVRLCVQWFFCKNCYNSYGKHEKLLESMRKPWCGWHLKSVVGPYQCLFYNFCKDARLKKFQFYVNWNFGGSSISRVWESLQFPYSS